MDADPDELTDPQYVLMRSKTCPSCRAVVKHRPVPALREASTIMIMIILGRESSLQVTKKQMMMMTTKTMMMMMMMSHRQKLIAMTLVIGIDIRIVHILKLLLRVMQPVRAK